MNRKFRACPLAGLASQIWTPTRIPDHHRCFYTYSTTTDYKQKSNNQLVLLGICKQSKCITELFSSLWPTPFTGRMPSGCLAWPPTSASRSPSMTPPSSTTTRKLLAEMRKVFIQSIIHHSPFQQLNFVSPRIC